MAIESAAIISIARSLGGMVETASVVTIWFARVRDLARLQSIDSDQIPTTIHAVLCQVLSVKCYLYMFAAATVSYIVSVRS